MCRDGVVVPKAAVLENVAILHSQCWHDTLC